MLRSRLSIGRSFAGNVVFGRTNLFGRALPTDPGFGRYSDREGAIVPFLCYAHSRLTRLDGRKLTKNYSNSDLMKIAVEEHLKCTEYPKVGVVVAKDGEILSTGFRGEVPRKHAERVALEKLAMPDRIGSTVFTTLEPCVAFQASQATESCADLIIASGVREVFVGVLDPNGTIYSQGLSVHPGSYHWSA